MHVRKIGKLLTAAALALGLAACSSQPAEPESYNVLCPTGAPALATLGAQDVENTTVTYTDGTDALTAELAKKTVNTMSLSHRSIWEQRSMKKQTLTSWKLSSPGEICILSVPRTRNGNRKAERSLYLAKMRFLALYTMMCWHRM